MSTFIDFGNVLNLQTQLSSPGNPVSGAFIYFDGSALVAINSAGSNLLPGTGTVTSVALTAPSILTVAGSPVTASGTLALTLHTQAKNLLFAGPSSGADAAPTFRSLVSADFPLGSFSTTQLATPSAPTVTPTGGTASSWSYKVVARDSNGFTVASSAGSTTTGAATLDGTHYNDVNWTAIAGAATYDVYRTVAATSPTTLGLLGNTASLTFRDNAVAGDSSTAPTYNSTGAISDGTGNLAKISYFWGGCGINPPTLIGTSTGTFQINSALRAVMFHLEAPVTVGHMNIQVATTADAGSHFYVGIYTADGGTLLLEAKGAADVSTMQNIAITGGGTVTLPSGYYYMAWGSDTTAGQVLGNVSYTQANNPSLYKNQNSAVRFGSCAGVIAAGALPKSLGTVTAISTTVLWPVPLFEV